MRCAFLTAILPLTLDSSYCRDFAIVISLVSCWIWLVRAAFCLASDFHLEYSVDMEDEIFCV